MTPDNGGGALGWLWAGLGNAVAVGKEVWAAFIAPGAVAYFAWRKRRDDRADAATKERRTEEERRDAEWKANLDRAGAQVQAHVKWQEERAQYAEAKLQEAETRADAAERELRRLEIYVERHEHTLADARRIADDARSAQGKPPLDWKPVPRPRLPGDPA